jgi:hypothetical protein
LLRAKEEERRSSIVYRYRKGKTIDIYTKEKTILGFAEYDNRSPMPSIGAKARPPPRHGGYKLPASCPQP